MSLSHSRPGLTDFSSDFYDSELFHIIAMQLEECISSGSDSSIPAVATRKSAPTFLGPYRSRQQGAPGAFVAASPGAEEKEEEEEGPIVASSSAIEEEEEEFFERIVAGPAAKDEEEDELATAAAVPAAKEKEEQPVITPSSRRRPRFARPVVEEDEDDEDYNDDDSRVPAPSHKRKKPPVRSPATPDSSQKRKKPTIHRPATADSSHKKKKPPARRPATPNAARERSDRPPTVPGAPRKTPCLGCIRSLLSGRLTAPCRETTRPNSNRCVLCDSGHRCRKPPLALKIPGRRLQMAFFAKDKKLIRMWRVTCRTLLSEYESGRPDSDPCDEESESSQPKSDLWDGDGHEESESGRPESDLCNEDGNEESEAESRFSLDELGI